jgi:flavin reductase (DIM6/NTAB) family NADH-FMN oxidoreductase RutF
VPQLLQVFTSSWRYNLFLFPGADPHERLPPPPGALNKAYRLLNHGPTVLVSAAHDGQRNIMAAAWAMPLDFEPPKVAVVLDKSTWTRQLLEASGTFVLNVPCVNQADIVQTVGNTRAGDPAESGAGQVSGLRLANLHR